MFSSRRSSDGQLAAQPERVRGGIREPVTRSEGWSCVEETVAGPCDACSAAAAVRVRLSSGSVLMLCGHHGRRHAPALRAQRAEVTGELAFATRDGRSVPTGAA